MTHGSLLPHTMLLRRHHQQSTWLQQLENAFLRQLLQHATPLPHDGSTKHSKYANKSQIPAVHCNLINSMKAAL
jgi:hypothetical protein